MKSPDEELLEARLYQELAKLHTEYARHIRIFISKISPILATTVKHFPYYTRHDANHGFHVTQRIAQIVIRDCFDSDSESWLGPAELFLLIAAAYAHDLGMTVFPGEETSLLDSLNVATASGWETDPILQEFLRENHSTRGGNYIAQNAVEVSVPQNLIAPLNWMMKSHNMSIPELDLALSTPFAAEERELDARQLSIILCIADAIEYSDTRVLDGVLNLISKDPSEAARRSYRENMKHLSVGNSLAVAEDGRIIVSGSFSEAEILSLAHHTFDQIEVWLKGYCEIERRSKSQRLRVRPESLLRRLELFGGRFERLGVRIDKQNIIDLISSNAIWRQDSGAVIRELVQNAVEACRYRSFHTPASAKYEPDIVVYFSRNDKTVSVRDNGCGMTERVILNHFLTVGNSRAKESAYSINGYSPIARFGVGFWSVFTIANRALVQTLAFEDAQSRNESKTTTGTSFTVETAVLKDYTVFSECKMQPETSITLQLKSDVIIDDLYEKSKNQFLCSQVPLRFELDSDTTPVSMSVPDIPDESLLERKFRRKAELGIEIFKWRGGTASAEVSVSILYRKLPSRATFLQEDGSSILFGTNTVIRWPLSAICGFRGSFFNPTIHLCFDLPRVGTAYVNWNNPAGFEYTIDRQSLIPNETSRNATTEAVELVHAAYRDFLRATNCYEPSAIYELNKESSTGGGNLFNIFTDTQLADRYTRWPDLLCYKVFVVRRILTPNSTPEIRYFNATQLAQQKGTVWVVLSHLLLAAGGGSNFIIDPSSVLNITYGHAMSRLGQISSVEECFVMEPSGPAAMLFDCDPESSVEFAMITAPVTTLVPILRINLDSVRYEDGPQNILATVTGKWGGTIYLREFQGPNLRPYQFLEQQRVLIKTSSKLKTYLEDLKAEGKLNQLADVIASLKEDETGYPPQDNDLAALLRG